MMKATKAAKKKVDAAVNGKQVNTILSVATMTYNPRTYYYDRLATGNNWTS